MARIALGTVNAPETTPAKKRDRKKGVKVDRSAALALVKSILAQPSLAAAAAYIRGYAEALPVTPPAPDYRTGRLVQRSGWREVLLSLADGLSAGRAAFPIFGMEGNEKLPFVTFSTLPLFTCPGAGACGTFCYSLKAWRYPAALARQIQNTLFLRFSPDVIESAFALIPNGLTFRLYVDGDFDSAETFAFWMRLLTSRPDLKAYGYSKSWDIIADHKAGGKAYAPNYLLNLSSGGKPQRTTEAEMMALPLTRGRFLAVKIDYRPEGVKGNIGFARYDDKAYHTAVKSAAAAAGIRKVFSCPGKCGDCHACGNPEFRGRDIANGVH